MWNQVRGKQGTLQAVEKPDEIALRLRKAHLPRDRTSYCCPRKATLAGGGAGGGGAEGRPRAPGDRDSLELLALPSSWTTLLYHHMLIFKVLVTHVCQH